MNVEKVEKDVNNVPYDELEYGELFTWGANQFAFMKLPDNKIMNVHTNEVTPVHSFLRSGNVTKCKHKLLVEGLS